MRHVTKIQLMSGLPLKCWITRTQEAASVGDIVLESSEMARSYFLVGTIF